MTLDMSKVKELFMEFFATLIVGIAILMVYALILHSVPPENKDIINVALGMVLAMAKDVVSYYFGSSKGSADKDELLAKSQPAPTSFVTTSTTVAGTDTEKAP